MHKHIKARLILVFEKEIDNDEMIFIKECDIDKDGDGFDDFFEALERELQFHKVNIIGFCLKCKRAFYEGHADRKYCTKKENPDCYRKRDAERARKFRSIRDNLDKFIRIPTYEEVKKALKQDLG